MGTWMRSDLRFDMTTAGIDFFHRIAHPPHPRVSVDVGKRRLSQTAEYEKLESIDSNSLNSKGQSQCSCSTSISMPFTIRCRM